MNEYYQINRLCGLPFIKPDSVIIVNDKRLAVRIADALKQDHPNDEIEVIKVTFNQDMGMGMLERVHTSIIKTKKTTKNDVSKKN